MIQMVILTERVHGGRWTLSEPGDLLNWASRDTNWVSLYYIACWLAELERGLIEGINGISNCD